MSKFSDLGNDLYTGKRSFDFIAKRSGWKKIFKLAKTELLLIANALMVPLLGFLSWAAALPLAIWHAPAPTTLSFGLALVGALLWLMPSGLPGRGLALFLCLPLIWLSR